MPQLRKENSPETVLVCKIISYIKQQLYPPHAIKALGRSLVFTVHFSIYAMSRKSKTQICGSNYFPQGSLKEQLASFTHQAVTLFSVRPYASKKYYEGFEFQYRKKAVQELLSWYHLVQHFNNTLIPQNPRPKYMYSNNCTSNSSEEMQ